MLRSASLRDVFGFVRFNLSFFSSFLGVLGFLLTNQVSPGVLFAGLGSFFACAGGFAYNGTTDVKEDRINRGRVNPLAESEWGSVIVLVVFSLGLLFSFLISWASLLFCSLMVLVGFAYSFFRLKAHFLVKNLYIGFCVPLLFLLGAGTLNPGIGLYYVFLSLFFFTGSLIADLRDYGGDKRVGLRTLPVVLGYKQAQAVVSVLLFGISTSIVFFGAYPFYPVSFLSLLMLVLLAQGRPNPAHLVGGISILMTVVWWFL